MHASLLTDCQNALAYFATAIGYMRQMFMKATGWLKIMLPLMLFQAIVLVIASHVNLSLIFEIKA
jgi:hypothetical protein